MEDTKRGFMGAVSRLADRIIDCTYYPKPRIFKNGNYIFDWLKVVGRIPLSLVVFVPAFYFAKESGKHRINEINNRRRQHIITTLDPYIELMKPENAEDLRVHVAKTVFAENLSSNESKENETGNILSQLSNLAKQIKGS